MKLSRSPSDEDGKLEELVTSEAPLLMKAIVLALSLVPSHTLLYFCCVYL